MGPAIGIAHLQRERAAVVEDQAEAAAALLPAGEQALNPLRRRGRVDPCLQRQAARQIGSRDVRRAT